MLGAKPGCPLLSSQGCSGAGAHPRMKEGLLQTPGKKWEGEGQAGALTTAANIPGANPVTPVVIPSQDGQAGTSQNGATIPCELTASAIPKISELGDSYKMSYQHPQPQGRAQHPNSTASHWDGDTLQAGIQLPHSHQHSSSTQHCLVTSSHWPGQHGEGKKRHFWEWTPWHSHLEASRTCKWGAGTP